jgi:hypothetical protein
MYILLTGFIIDQQLTLLTFRGLIQTVEGNRARPDLHNTVVQISCQETAHLTGHLVPSTRGYGLGHLGSTIPHKTALNRLGSGGESIPFSRLMRH